MTTNAQRREALDRELFDLDIPSLPITDVITILADWAGRSDPAQFFIEVIGNQRVNMSTEEALLDDLVDAALETSAQLSQIGRALQIEAELNAMGTDDI